MILALLLIPLQADIESMEPVTTYYKKGAWTSIVIRIKTGGPFKGELTATTDARPTFARAVDFGSAGLHTLTLPVFFTTDYGSLAVQLESEGRRVAHRELDQSRFKAVQAFDVIVVASPTTWAKDESWEFGPQRVYGTRFDFSKLETWGGEALETVDVLVDAPASGDRLFAWRAMGGQLLGAANFKPEAVRPRAVVAPDAPRLAPDRPLRSMIRRDSAVWALLGYGTAALALFGFLATRKTPAWLVLASIPLLAGAFWVVFAAAFPRAPIIVHVRPVWVSEGESNALLRITSVATPEKQIVSLPLGWLAKPPANLPVKLVLDPSSARTRVDQLPLEPGAVLEFVEMGTCGDPVYPLRGDGTAVTNGPDPVKRAFLWEEERTSVPRPLAPGAAENLDWSSEPQRLDELELALARWVCRSGRFVIAALDKSETTARTPGSDPVIEWQTAPAILVRRIR